MIRPARPDEFPALDAIEAAAAELFRGTAMEFVLDHPPPARKAPLAPDRRIRVAADAADKPLGFLEARLMGGWLHIVEISVHPEAQRQGLGGRLIRAACAEAAADGLEAVSLTTDRHLPWNAPAYQRLGFAELPAEATPRWLAEILSREAAAGFDPARRVAMSRRP